MSSPAVPHEIGSIELHAPQWDRAAPRDCGRDRVHANFRRGRYRSRFCLPCSGPHLASTARKLPDGPHRPHITGRRSRSCRTRGGGVSLRRRRARSATGEGRRSASADRRTGLRWRRATRPRVRRGFRQNERRDRRAAYLLRVRGRRGHCPKRLSLLRIHGPCHGGARPRRPTQARSRTRPFRPSAHHSRADGRLSARLAVRQSTAKAMTCRSRPVPRLARDSVARS